jgi:hypothetical protein
LDHVARSIRKRQGASAGFVRVATVEIPSSAGQAEWIELVVLGGVRVRVPAQFEATTLRRVLDVVEGR